MNRLFICGDTHGELEITRLSYKNWPLGRELDRNDYVVVLGDFGFPWGNKYVNSDNWWLNWIENKPWTTLFIDGNHENFTILNSFQVEYWNGGKTHMLRPHVRHLMRGEIFNLCGYTCFCMGGAASHDKAFRKESISWWPEEIPNYVEFENAVNNLRAHNMTVDYIFTHCAPVNTASEILRFRADSNVLTSFLEKYVYSSVIFRRWWCGHFHRDELITNNFGIIYKNIIEILPNNEFQVVNYKNV